MFQFKNRYYTNNNNKNKLRLNDTMINSGKPKNSSTVTVEKSNKKSRKKHHKLPQPQGRETQKDCILHKYQKLRCNQFNMQHILQSRR